MAQYSLANYKLSVKIPDTLASSLMVNEQNSITIGGSGSYLDSISIHINKDLWSIEGDSTGSYVYNKNLDRTGDVTVSLNMMSPQVAQFKILCDLYYQSENEYEGLTLTLMDNNSNLIVTCHDCLLSKIPDQQFQDTSQNQSWTFLCGKVDYNHS